MKWTRFEYSERHGYESGDWKIYPTEYRPLGWRGVSRTWKNGWCVSHSKPELRHLRLPDYFTTLKRAKEFVETHEVESRP
jgi:hypothetical protein